MLAMLSLAGVLSFAPPPGKGDLAQAKKLYAEGDKALAAKSYTEAMQKFEQAYGLAPDKHLFNYNIAVAAELLGDCDKARRHYQMFIDLVPEHPERKKVSAKLAKLAKTCVVDDESTAVISPGERRKRDADRAKLAANRTLETAWQQTRDAAALYAAIAGKFDAPPFRHMAAVRKRWAKKLAKLSAEIGVELEAADGTPEVPGSIEGACRKGVGTEKRNAEAYAAALEVFDDAKLTRALARYERRAADRDAPMFESNCPR